MELLIGLLMNVLGNDLYDRCPRLAKWIIRKAVARLPEEKRAEYEEAWLAHLADCETKVDQVRHALGVYWSVGGIVNAGPRAKRSYRLDFMIAGSGMLAFSAGGEAVANFIAGMPWYLLLMYVFQIVPSIFVVIVGLRLRKEKGNIIEI